MRRYSHVFLVVALFCFLFPFVVITPAKNAGTYQMTGWDMLTTQNIGLQKQPPVVLHVPLRAQVLLALLGGAAAIIVKLTKRNDVAWLGAAVTVVAAISLCTITTSSLPVQLTDGQNVLYQFENPPVQLLPAFYVSLCLMGAAVVSSLLNLSKQPALQFASAVAWRPAHAPASTQSGGRVSSFCTKCGGGLAPGARFCNRCGTVVAALSAVARPIEYARSVADQVPVTSAPGVAASPVVAVDNVATPQPRSAPLPLPPAMPVAVPVRVAGPPTARPAFAWSGFSLAAKLGFAATAVVVGVAVWFAVRPSTNHRASMTATTVSISPANITVVPGGTVRIMALVTGDEREVQWSIEEGSSGGSIEPGGATVQNGTVFLLGNYKAPYAPGIYHVVAVSAADQTRKARAQVIVGYGGLGRF